jgi:Tc toxin complex TcA C-terminal TcB-binding domain
MLSLDLKRLESAYLDRNRREFEITKHISLASLDPAALIELKETGQCVFEVPELLFDLDYPGHYMRRIRSVAVSVPCVVGPYTSVGGTLTLENNRFRRSRSPQAPYAEDRATVDSRFEYDWAPVQSIATSGAQNDSGVFELNFRDERYLPFEGAGAVGRWRFELPSSFRAFDYNTISDVVLHLRYTSRYGGDELEARVVATDTDLLKRAETSPLSRAFSIRHEFSSEWRRFLFPSVGSDQTLLINLSESRFPFFAAGRKIVIQKIKLFLASTFGGEYEAEITAPAAPPATFPMLRGSSGQLHQGTRDTLATPGLWSVRIRRLGSPDFQSLNPDEVSDVVLLCNYTLE